MIRKIYFFINTSILKLIGPLLPLFASFFSISIELKTDISDFSLLVQSCSALMIFGTLVDFSINTANASDKKILNKLINLKLVYLVNFVVIFSLGFFAFKDVNIFAISVFVSYVIAISSANSISDYRKNKWGMFYKELLVYSVISFISISAGLLFGNVYIYFFLSVFLILLYIGHDLYATSGRRLVIKLALVWKIYVLHLKKSLWIFLLGYVTPISIFANGMILKNRYGNDVYVGFTQMYGVFSILVFVVNVRGQRLLMDFSEKFDQRKLFIESLVGCFIVLFSALFLYKYGKKIGEAEFGGNFFSVVLLVASAAFFSIVNIGSQVLLLRKKNILVLFLNIFWAVILMLIINSAGSLELVWGAYLISFIMLAIAQNIVIWKFV